MNFSPQAGSGPGVLADVLGQLPDAVFITDLEGQITHWLGKAEQIFGYRVEDVCQRSVLLLFPLHIRQRVKSSFLEILQTRGEYFGELRCMRSDQSEVPIELSAQVVCDPGGRPVCMVGVARDISQRDISQRTALEPFPPSRPGIAAGQRGGPLQLDPQQIAGELNLEYAKWEAVLRQFPVGMIIVDPVTEQVLFRNEMVKNFWKGHPLPSPYEVPKLYRGIDQRGRRMKYEDWPFIRTVQTGEIVLSEEFELVLSETDHRHLRLSCAPIRDRQGGVFVIAVTYEDISKHKEMEREFRETERRFRQLAENIEEAFWMADPHAGKVIYVSPAYERIWGKSCEDLLLDRQSLLEAIHPEDRPRVLEAMKAQARGERTEEEYRIVRPDGSVRWVLDRATPVREGKKIVRVAGVAADISERKQAEIALRKSERRFEQAQHAAKVGAFEWDLSTGELVWIAEMPALGAAFTENSPAERLGHIHPDDRERMLDFARQLGRQPGPFEVEFRAGPKEGPVVWISSQGEVLADAQGHPVRAVGVCQDVTDRKRAEELLRQSERLATAGRMAAAIAHEINNPLEAVTNLLYLLGKADSLDPTAREYANLAQQEIARVAQVARQTLAFYRESSTPAQLDIPQLLDGVLTLYSPRIESRGVRVGKSYSCSRHVLAFAGELRQVFSNLLVNALDATPAQGTVQVRVRDAKGGERSMEGVRVLIADTGAGIPEEVRRKIFEPFFTTKEDSGTGLGLWVVKGILSKRGGTIRVHSSTRPGHSGTCFSIFLPLKMTRENAAE